MNLADWLKGDHEPSERLTAAVTLCRAVSEHSGRGLDLDPSHIQVSGDGECRPTEGKVVPSGRYRPPEMAQGQPPVPQSQVFTVGVLCFEILSGRDFESRGGPLLRDLRRDLPRDVSDAVQACLEMDAEWRPKDVSYLLGLLEGQAASGGSSGGKAAARGGRPAAVSAAPVNRARRGAPAPRPWPLLAFALVALAVSIGTAFYRLRQPIEPPALPPPPASTLLPSPVAAASPVATALPSPSASPGRAVAANAPAPSPSVRAAAAAPTSRVPSPAATATPVAVAAAPAVAPATPAPAPEAPARAPQPTTPAAVTNVSPPVLHRGANVLVDVHGVGLRSDHQVRVARPREAARGIEVMRQRYVGPALLQVLLRIDAGAPTGAYVLSLVDGTGNATNARPFEVAK
jgi:hypothetical protein